VAKQDFVKKELIENPEFFNAFPHLQGLFNVDEEGKLDE